MRSRTEPAKGRISQGMPMVPVSPNRLPTQHSNTPRHPAETRRQPASDGKLTLNLTHKVEPSGPKIQRFPPLARSTVPLFRACDPWPRLRVARSSRGAARVGERNFPNHNERKGPKPC